VLPFGVKNDNNNNNNNKCCHRSPGGVRSTVVSLSVCLHNSKTTRPIFAKCSCMLPVAVARSSKVNVKLRKSMTNVETRLVRPRSSTEETVFQSKLLLFSSTSLLKVVDNANGQNDDYKISDTILYMYLQ